MRVQGEGEPVLLLNGLTRPKESWGPFAQALSRRTIVTFDAPGVGGSPNPILPLSIVRLAGLAASILDAVGLAHADVLGYSYGGAIAQQLAVDAPTRVRRLVLVSTSCGIGATPGGPYAFGSLRPSPEQNSWPRPNVLGTWWQSLAISTWSSIPFLGSIQAPTLVVCGARDRVAPPANSALLARRIPGADLVLLPAGHDLQKRGPARMLADTVGPFLADRRVVESRLMRV